MARPVDYDVIVVGAGIEGSATAYSLAKSNQKTLLVEQFALPHTRGSSHGQTRIIRKAYEASHYVRMMPAAYRQWEELEKAEHTEIMRKTGLVTVAPLSSTLVDNTIRSLKGFNADHECLDADQVNKRFPILSLDPSYKAVYDPNGGVLRADKALTMFWNQFRKYGGTLHDGEPLISVTPGDIVVVTTSLRQYTCRSVVLCLGPWTSKFIKPLGLHLPLKPVRISVQYWRANTDQHVNTPCFNGIFNGINIYGLGCYEYPNHVKICYHGGPDIDPDMRDSDEAVAISEANLPTMKQIVKEFFPGLEPDPSIQETCIYTNTPDKDFILDAHPHWNNIVIGAGFSGHGFKLAPVVGDILADLAIGRKPSVDIKPFTIERFFKNNSKL